MGHRTLVSRRGPFGARPALRLLLLAAVALVPACSSSRDLVDLTPPTAYREKSAPLDPVLVRLKADIRPTEERGTRKFLEKSYIGGNAFREPTDVSLLRILARDLVVSGAVRDASFVPQEQPYLLDVVITHLAASYGEDLGSLTVVLPTSAIRGVCAVRLQLRDRSGRTFLDEVFEHEERRGGALVAGLEVEAARALAVAVRAAVDAALPRIRASVDAFWARYR